MNEIPTPKTIIAQYDLKHDERFACAINAILNFTRIMADQSQGNQPEIYFHQNHAYLIFEGRVLNGGVTAEKGVFKDFSVPELKSNGSNDTVIFLGYALSRVGMGMVRKNIPESTLNKAIPKMQYLYRRLNSTQG